MAQSVTRLQRRSDKDRLKDRLSPHLCFSSSSGLLQQSGVIDRSQQSGPGLFLERFGQKLQLTDNGELTEERGLCAAAVFGADAYCIVCFV